MPWLRNPNEAYSPQSFPDLSSIFPGSFPVLSLLAAAPGAKVRLTEGKTNDKIPTN